EETRRPPETIATSRLGSPSGFLDSMRHLYDRLWRNTLPVLPPIKGDRDAPSDHSRSDFNRPRPARASCPLHDDRQQSAARSRAAAQDLAGLRPAHRAQSAAPRQLAAAIADLQSEAQ